MKEKTKCETKKLLKIKGKLSLEGKAPVTKKKKRKNMYLAAYLHFFLQFTENRADMLHAPRKHCK